MKVIAHRGGAGLGKENTLSCIAEGLRFSPSMVEIDVHLTSDCEVVVCHDPCIDRTTDGKGLISEMTLQEVKASHIVDAEGNATDERIPTLREVIELIGDRAAILLEIKREDETDDGLEKFCMDIIYEYGLQETIVVQSFNDIVLERFHAMDQNIRLEKLLFVRPFNMAAVRSCPWIASYNIYFRGLVTRRFVDRMHSMGKEVKVWTIKKPSQIPCRNLDGVITDRPDIVG
jgi:glycerophosphoryl diester phosphodiesterase